MRISDWSSDVCSSDLLGAEIDAIALPLGGTVAQHEVREVEVELMGRHVGATHHEAHVAEGAGVDDLLVVRLGDSVELAGLGVVDEEIGRASCRERVWPYV